MASYPEHRREDDQHETSSSIASASIPSSGLKRGAWQDISVEDSGSETNTAGLIRNFVLFSRYRNHVKQERIFEQTLRK